MNSKITIHDSQSDITFVGKISKPFKLVGKFFDCNSNDIGYVSGSITKGVNWKDGRNLINAIEHQDTVPQIKVISTTRFVCLFLLDHQDLGFMYPSRRTSDLQ